MMTPLDRFDAIRLIEAQVFASAEPVPLTLIAELLGESPYAQPDKLEELLADLQTLYANRGVNLVRVDAAVAFRTAADIAERLTIHRSVSKKLSRAGLETLAIIAYHQPVTRPEIEEIRGVALSRGTLDLLLEQQWIAPAGRRQAPGKPLQWAVTPQFLDHFGLAHISDLPGIDELKAAGLLDRRGTLAAAGLSGGLPTEQAPGNPLDDVDVEGIEDLMPDADVTGSVPGSQART